MKETRLREASPAGGVAASGAVKSSGVGFRSGCANSTPCMSLRPSQKFALQISAAISAILIHGSPPVSEFALTASPFRIGPLTIPGASTTAPVSSGILAVYRPSTSTNVGLTHGASGSPGRSGSPAIASTLTGRCSRRESSHASAMRRACSASRPSQGLASSPRTTFRKASSSAS